MKFILRLTTTIKKKGCFSIYDGECCIAIHRHRSVAVRLCWRAVRCRLSRIDQWRTADRLSCAALQSKVVDRVRTGRQRAARFGAAGNHWGSRFNSNAEWWCEFFQNKRYLY